MTSSKPTVMNHRLLPFFAITLVALLPIVGASLMYFGGYGIPKDSVHNGELLTPPIPLPAMMTSKSNELPASWQLISISHSHDCKTSKTDTSLNTSSQLSMLNQVKKALGREADRVSIQQVCKATLSQDVLTQIKGNQDELFGIIDPIGNLMMIYPANIDQRSIYKDMKRLLKYSKLG